MEASLSRTALRSAPQQITRIRYYSTVQDLPRPSGSFTDTAPPAPARSTSTFDDAVKATGPRFDWTREQISQIHQTPLMELAFAAVSRPLLIHSKHLQSAGIGTSSLPQTFSRPAMYSDEYQDGWLHRRLLILRSILPLQDRLAGDQALRS